MCAKLTLPKKSLEWYSERISLEISLFKLFVKLTEKRIKDDKIKYNRITSKKYPSKIIKELHEYLLSEHFNPDGVLNQYFPNIQRRAALITLFSFFENELDKLCNLFKEIEKYSLSLNDIHGNGIERSTLFLKKVVGLQLDKNKLWDEIKLIQKIRNTIVHNNGVLKDEDSNSNSIINNYFKKEADYIYYHFQIIIREGFLANMLNTFDAFFKLIDKSIILKEHESLTN